MSTINQIRMAIEEILDDVCKNNDMNIDDIAETIEKCLHDIDTNIARCRRVNEHDFEAIKDICTEFETHYQFSNYVKYNQVHALFQYNKVLIYTTITYLERTLIVGKLKIHPQYNTRDRIDMFKNYINTLSKSGDDTSIKWL